MTNKNLIKAAIEAKNIKLAKVLFDNSDIDSLFEKKHPWHYYLNEIGMFKNSEGCNFIINYLYKNRRLDLVKKIFSNSNNLSSASGFLDKKNFIRIRKITHKNWWITKNHHCFREAVSSNNLFMVQELIKIYQNSNCEFKLMILKMNDCLEENFRNQYRLNYKKQDFRILKLIHKQYNELPSIIINSVFRNYRKDDLLERLKKIMQIFKIKQIDYSENNIAEVLDDKKIFFYLYKKTKRDQRSKFFNISNYSNMISLLERRLINQYRDIDKEIVVFLLKKNLKIISQSN